MNNLKSEWKDISTAPKDGTRFVARLLIPATYMNRFEMKDRYSKKITWYGKTSHVPLYGWCHGQVENVDLWSPTTWKPLKSLLR